MKALRNPTNFRCGNSFVNNNSRLLKIYSFALALLVSVWRISMVESATISKSFAFAFIVREKATVDDVTVASKILFLEKMNPYIPSRENMVVVYDDGQTTGGTSNNVIGFAQTRPLGSPTEEMIQYHELASLYVKPDYRRQGVGSAIVRTLLQSFDSKYQSLIDSELKHIVCLLTLKPTIPFYSKYGFQIVAQNSIPAPLKLEYKLGSILSFILGNDLVCMVRWNVTNS